MIVVEVGGRKYTSIQNANECIHLDLSHDFTYFVLSKDGDDDGGGCVDKNNKQKVSLTCCEIQKDMNVNIISYVFQQIIYVQQ